MNDIKDHISTAIRDELPSLIGLSEWLHAHPELAWQEYKSAARCAQFLRDRGFVVEEQYVGLETALHATFGTGSRRLALMAEYDALPGIGHACGHNLIAAMSLGAAVGLSKVADELDLTVEVFGTPAEEGYGGKIEMLDRGAFEGLDFAMMAHPAPVDVVRAEPMAVAHWEVTFYGHAAHAASYPTQGINAADAFTISEVAIALLRQQLPPTVRVHGILTHGGDAPNAIPHFTRGRWYVRASTMQELEETQEKVLRCFRAGALATGCRVEIRDESQPYSDFTTDEPALSFYENNARSLGRDLRTEGPETQMCRASTDMANVSKMVRSIHPYVGVGCYPVLNHQAEFADACVGETANQTLIDGATALAWTGVDVAKQWLDELSRSLSGSPL
ncbi:M20 family metallopeptidase [Corynebacterium sp. YIM 101645]|uniref:Peptidase M20 domain-containing protein 2 n=1 Tax=Corynebacterium lemuris TaxID=1859292 RepID=A0ABT2G020_9CORY|nr:M20 family metallopeptidase [Corynebacterium lemuris]MCS5480853.1 M20 family metallopeptidase [Corynebacterium lemuris]